jgi:hypothetical protein
MLEMFSSRRDVDCELTDEAYRKASCSDGKRGNGDDQ